MQRLADKPILSGEKYSKEKWTEIIRKLIDNGEDDFGVYDTLRKNYIGKTLEESLKINIVSINDISNNNNNNNGGSGGSGSDSSNCSLKNDNNNNNNGNYNNNNNNNNNNNKNIEVINTENGEDGRANFMVDMTIECIPQTPGIKTGKRNSIYCVLLT